MTAYDRLKFLQDFEDEIDDLDSDSEAAKLFDEYTYSIDFDDVEKLGEISEAPTPRPGAAEDETSVLMIHNERTSDSVLGTGQYYTSSTSISLSAGTSAKVSVWVRTNDLAHYYSENEDTAVKGNAGAYIRINQTVGGTPLDPSTSRTSRRTANGRNTPCMCARTPSRPPRSPWCSASARALPTTASNT